MVRSITIDPVTRLEGHLGVMASWLADSNTRLVRDMVEANALNAFRSADLAMTKSLRHGEMKKFDNLVKQQKDVPGLMEFTLYTPEGKIFSSTTAALRKPPPSHPKESGGQEITDNCLRCHSKAEIALPIDKIPPDLLKKVMSQEEKTVQQSRHTIEIFKPQIVSPDCIRCHRKWQIGQVRGISYFKFSKKALLDLEGKIQEELARIKKDALLTSVMMTFGIILILWPAAYFFTRKNLVMRLKSLGDRIKAMAQGDLTERIPVTAQLDEISAIAVYVNTMADRLATTAQSVGQQAETVAGVVAVFDRARDTLGVSSKQSNDLALETQQDNQGLAAEITAMEQQVSQAAANIDAISTAAGKLSVGVHTVASATEEASMNVMTMTAAAEEMTANISAVNTSLTQVNDSVDNISSAVKALDNSFVKIRQQCQDASRKSSRADGNAKASSAVMAKLAASAQEIGQIIGVINNMAEQTNMLALNAFIEAASAGDAGKGFAVVAGEVKTLALQTTEATVSITRQIGEIQDHAKEASASAKEITGLIGEISHINETIEWSIQEQANRTRNLAEAIGAVTLATHSVMVNAKGLELGSQEVARVAAETASGTSEIAKSATDMAVQATAAAEQSDSARVLVQAAREATAKTVMVSEGVKEKMAEVCRTSEEMSTLIGNLGEVSQTMEASSKKLHKARNELDKTVGTYR